jgi:cytochrome c556
MRTNWGATILALGAFALCAGTLAAQAPRISVQELEGFMKAISSANAALGKKVTGNDLAGAASDAQTIVKTLTSVETFWTQNSKSDGAMWAMEAQKTATALAAALTSGDATNVAALRKQLGGNCTTCHTAYREGSPQTGGYTIKAGVVTQ